MSSTTGKLWIVATPLGNPGDFSPRAASVLSGADCILCEDTRRSGLLLSRLGIAAKKLLSFHEHNEGQRLEAVLKNLREGRTLALISDAGTPLLSDPGYRLVRACREEGIAVSPVPGPSAPVAALSAAGLPPLPFCFLGFAPRKEGDLADFFEPFVKIAGSIIFFERKDRLGKTLEVAHAILGRREVCLARELTKTFEEFIFTVLGKDLSLPDNLMGEITVILGPPLDDEKTGESEILRLLREQALRGSKPRETARLVQSQVSGWTIKEIYALLGKCRQ